jgi:uncharacterized protein YbcV (DUF1398 family)
VDTFYLAGGETHTEKMAHRATEISESFSESGVVAAIRAAQADKIRYPEFLNRAMAAGVTAYWVFINGRKQSTLAAKGACTSKSFPDPNPRLYSPPMRNRNPARKLIGSAG